MHACHGDDASCRDGADAMSVTAIAAALDGYDISRRAPQHSLLTRRSRLTLSAHAARSHGADHDSRDRREAGRSFLSQSCMRSPAPSSCKVEFLVEDVMDNDGTLLQGRGNSCQS